LDPEFVGVGDFVRSIENIHECKVFKQRAELYHVEYRSSRNFRATGPLKNHFRTLITGEDAEEIPIEALYLSTSSLNNGI
jgi:hypothetical protein